RPFWSSVMLLGLLSPALRAADSPVETTLPSGMRIICRRDTSSPLVALQVFVRVGAAQENPEKPGIGNFVARTLFSGGLSDEIPEVLAGEIGDLGGNVTATWQPDWTQISVLTLGDKFTDAAFLVTNVLKNADFDKDVVSSTRDDITSDIDSANAGVFQTAYQGVRQIAYGGTRYTLPPMGTVSSVNHISRDDLLAYYNRFYVPQNFVFVVVGNIDPAEAVAKINEDMSDFPTRGRGSRRPFQFVSDPLPALTADPPPVHAVLPDLAEAAVLVGYRVPPVSSPDYPAVEVANALLGGMKTSRLFTELREKQGLAYELGSILNSQAVAGDLTAYVLASPPTRTDPATKKSVSAVGFIKEQILHQVAALQAAPPTPTALLRAQHFLIGTQKIRHERLEDRATLLGTAVLQSPLGIRYDTDYSHSIHAVTAADVQRVAQKYFVHPIISVVEPDTNPDSIVSE
ncbi:MAG: insulinase family protein, partial [Armatimonadota bacterium]|nr:insulinase family protein [Armatimonadota bacterium]